MFPLNPPFPEDKIPVKAPFFWFPPSGGNVWWEPAGQDSDWLLHSGPAKIRDVQLGVGYAWSLMNHGSIVGHVGHDSHDHDAAMVKAE